MKFIDNKNKTLLDDLRIEINSGSKIYITAACFSVYAYQALKHELGHIDELRFIFNSPSFISEQAPKEKREFYIPRINRERSLYGTEFELKLRNELTQKAIAKECADWIRSKATFKSNITNENMPGFMCVNDKSYAPINDFTTVELGCERGNNAYKMIMKNEVPFSKSFLDIFNELWKDKSRLQDVTDEVLNSISTMYSENPPEFIYYVTLYNIFSEFLDDISEDVLPNDAVGFKQTKIWNMLYNFQKDAVLAIINKLEKYNGCILADSVGLGKTFTALAVIKYYENRNKSVLVLCPKKLSNNWNTYKTNYKNNPILEDRLRYDVLYHTDLNRTKGKSNGIDLSRLNWANYDLVVIDESHNFRNGGKLTEDEDSDENQKQNRYLKLLNNVIRKGVKTKVLMLSATPVNNKFLDLKNQLQLAYEGDSRLINGKLNTTRSIDEIFRNAQKEFTKWSKGSPQERTTENLLNHLDYDFFEVLDSVTIARSRKHIQQYYNTEEIGSFPTRLPPISKSPHLTDLREAITYDQIFSELMKLTLCIYTPSHFIKESKREKYAELYDDTKYSQGFTQANRERGIRRLTAINLMKRMESSAFSFNLTLKRVKELIDSTLETIRHFEQNRSASINLTDITNIHESEFDEDDLNTDDIFSVGRKVKIQLEDIKSKPMYALNAVFMDFYKHIQNPDTTLIAMFMYIGISVIFIIYHKNRFSFFPLFYLLAGIITVIVLRMFLFINTPVLYGVLMFMLALLMNSFNFEIQRSDKPSSKLRMSNGYMIISSVAVLIVAAVNCFVFFSILPVVNYNYVPESLISDINRNPDCYYVMDTPTEKDFVQYTENYLHPMWGFRSEYLENLDGFTYFHNSDMLRRRYLPENIYEAIMTNRKIYVIDKNIVFRKENYLNENYTDKNSYVAYEQVNELDGYKIYEVKQYEK